MGLRMTSARRAIIDVLDESKSHLTVSQIHERLRERLPSLNLTTVYRALDLLVKHQYVSVSYMGAGNPVYELITDEPHHHLVCQSCEHIQELQHEHVADFFNKIFSEIDYKVTTNHLVLYGVCNQCQDREEETLRTGKEDVHERAL